MAVEVCTVPVYGEVRRETGFGLVKTFQAPERGKRNAKVEINAEHLTDPVSGWIDTHEDRDVYAAAAAAWEQGQRVFYTVYTARLPGVDADIAFAELTKQQKRRLVVEIEAVNGEGVPLANGQPVPPRQVETPAQAPDPPVPPPRDTQPPPEPDPPTDGGRPANRGPRVVEAKPWEAQNSDGSPNQGSFAVMAAEDMVLHAHALMVQAGLEPVPRRVGYLARRLLRCADEVQARHRADGHADRMASSHTRARATVRAALLEHPVPFGEGADPEVVEKWMANLVESASALMSVVLELVDREVA